MSIFSFYGKNIEKDHFKNLRKMEFAHVNIVLSKKYAQIKIDN